MRADTDQALGGFDCRVIINLSLPKVISNHPGNKEASWQLK
jgi:hypothetical protein